MMLHPRGYGVEAQEDETGLPTLSRAAVAQAETDHTAAREQEQIAHAQADAAVA